MKIKRFRGSEIHGYLNFDIKFRDDLTFLTGINGGGKTTVINSIVALLSPNISTLSSLEFRTISVEVEHDNRELVITASKKDAFVNLSTSASRDPIVVQPYVFDEYAPPYKNEEAERLHFAEIQAVSVEHPVMKDINGLPTPMFLDLDRRSRSVNVRARSRFQPNSATRSKNVFGGSLNRSLIEAEVLAQEEFRDTLVKVSGIEKALRTELILLLLPTEEQMEYGALTMPTAQDLQSIADIKSRLDDLPQILAVPRERLRRQVSKFLQSMEDHSKVLKQQEPSDDFWDKISNNSILMSAVLSWSSNKYQMRKFSGIVSKVVEFNEERNKIRAKLSQYEIMVNRFLGDNGKRIYFSERGEIKVSIGGNDDQRDITSLSSGESQIFVIITHLFFNPSAQNANVFIIDEPELSLHVQWQEMFVDSVLSANPNVQYIMSTHSPSIILDRVVNCIDLDSKRVGGVRG